MAHRTGTLLDWPAPPLRPVSPPTYWRCEPVWSWDSVPLKEFLLWCVLAGDGALWLDGLRYRLEPGVCFVFAPGQAPRARHDPRRRLTVFGLHFRVPAAAGRVVPPGNGTVVADRALLTALAARCEAAHRQTGPYHERQVLLCLEQLLCLLWTPATPAASTDPVLDGIATLIRRDPARRWSVAELARRANLSPAQFTRRFRAHTGRSPARYLIEARTARARDLLTRTTMTVTQVARTLGYPDPAYFSRQYRQVTGDPPSRR